MIEDGQQKYSRSFGSWNAAVIQGINENSFNGYSDVIDEQYSMRIFDMLNMSAEMLYAASISGVSELLELRLNAHATTVNSKTSRVKRTPFYLTWKYGNLDVVEILLVRGADPGLDDDKDGTALMATTDRQDADIVHVLLENGANPDSSDEPGLFRNHRGPALHRAASKGSVSIVKLLLEYEAETNVVKNDGTTP